MSPFTRLFGIYGAALVAGTVLASCNGATPDPNKVHPAGTTTAGLQQLRSGSAGGVANSAPTTEDNNGLATAPMDGSTTSVAPATANILTGTTSGTTEPSGAGSGSASAPRDVKAPPSGMNYQPSSGK